MATRKYRRYSPEFKRHALKRASEDGVTDKSICEELQISERQLRRWRDQYRLLGEIQNRYGDCDDSEDFRNRTYGIPIHLLLVLLSHETASLPAAASQADSLQQFNQASAKRTIPVGERVTAETSALGQYRTPT